MAAQNTLPTYNAPYDGGSFTDNQEVHQLAVGFPYNGRNYHGWVRFYTKQVDTGKKDKNNKPITKTVRDFSKPATYDSVTSKYTSNKMIASLVSSNSDLKKAVAGLIIKVLGLQKAVSQSK